MLVHVCRKSHVEVVGQRVHHWLDVLVDKLRHGKCPVLVSQVTLDLLPVTESQLDLANVEVLGCGRGILDGEEARLRN